MSDDEANVASTMRYLYASRFVSQSTYRLLQFAVPMMFITLWTNTFLPTAVLTFTTYTTHFFVLPYCGSLIDVAHRRHSAMVLISIKSACNALALFSLYVCYVVELGGIPNLDFSQGHVGFACCCVLLITGEAAEEAWTISLERNWVVLVADGSEDQVSKFNVALRRIDLCCLTFAPLCFGAVLQLVGEPSKQLVLGTVLLGVLFACAWLPESHYARKAYDTCSLLQHRDGDGTVTSTKDLVGSKSNVVQVLLQSWQKYASHRVFWASFSYSMIYFTVLDGGSVMLSFLKWSGVSETVIGLSRGAGAVMGLVGSAMFAPMRDFFSGSLERTGAVSLWLFWVTLLPIGWAQAFLPSAAFGYVLLVCVAAARLFLWLFDLDHTMIMQLYVADGERAEVNGAQSALYRVFWVLLSVACLVFSAPTQFAVLVKVSLVVVGISCCIFSTWAVFSQKPTSCDTEGQSRVCLVEDQRHAESDDVLSSAL